MKRRKVKVMGDMVTAGDPGNPDLQKGNVVYKKDASSDNNVP